MSLDYPEVPQPSNGGGILPGTDDDLDDGPQQFEIDELLWKRFPYYGDEIAAEICERFDDHIEHWSSSAYSNAVFKAFNVYHGLEDSEGAPNIGITEAGEQGELLSMDLNYFRSTVKHGVAMVTKDRPEWEPQARTTDSAASKQVPLTRNLVEYAMSAGLINDINKQFETSKPCASAFMVLGWDAKAGLNKKGWFTHRVVPPWEMAHEQVRHYDSECTWWIYRVFESRWDWIARFSEMGAPDPVTGKKRQLDPDKARKLYALDQSDEPYGYSPMDGIDADMMRGGDGCGDRIATLHCFVKPTAACPEGRYVIVAGKQLVLQDGPNPYGDEIPITRLCSAEFIGTSIPISDTWMLLAPTEAMNAIVSTILTRADLFGVPGVGVSVGTDFNPVGDFGGAKMIEFPPGAEPPKAIDLLQIPRELGQFFELLRGSVDQLSGVNSVTRGQPEENITSGSMAALMQAMAIQYNSADDRAYALNLERIGTLLVRIFQLMADEEVLIGVCGEDEAWSVTGFKKDGLDQILRVAIKVANPITKTAGFRMEMGTMMVQNGLLKSPDEFKSIVETGNVHRVFRTALNSLNYVKTENEMMSRGEAPQVMIWDNDMMHISEHVGELDPTRDKQEITALKYKHVMEHYESWTKKSQSTPDILAALGVPPLPQALQVGQQAMQMKSMAMGAPPAPPAEQAPGPRQQEQPGREEAPAAKPGPKAAPPGQEPSQSAPKQPSPAASPDGAQVA